MDMVYAGLFLIQSFIMLHPSPAYNDCLPSASSLNIHIEGGRR